MKKISLIALAVCSMILVSCKNNTPDKNEPEKVKFEVKYKPDAKSNWVVVKEGDVITFDKPNSTDPEKPDEYMFEGKIFSNVTIKVVIDAVRDYQEGTTDTHCTDRCMDGNGQKTETIEPGMPVEKGSDDESGLPFGWHCTPKAAGDNNLTLTVYQKDDKNNKLTFKINFKKS